MPKLRGYCGTVLILLIFGNSLTFAQYRLRIQPIDKDSLFIRQKLAPPASFLNRTTCTSYIFSIPSLLQGKGYMTASVDSIHYDSTGATIRLYFGEIYRWDRIRIRKTEAPLLLNAGWNDRTFSGHPMDYAQFRKKQEALLDWMENNGYPFAKIGLDSIVMDDKNRISANLKIDKGPLYKIDSIRVYGAAARISRDFLKRYLNIPNGSIYRRDKLETISKKLRELPYVEEQEPWKLMMLADGSVINLYLKPKKSSQINALIGFLPSSDPLLGNKILVTGEATIDLRNALGNGETIALNWQQLQPQSPRLNIVFQQPYIFKSPFGLNVTFDLYKQDSSYINLNLTAGAQYDLSATQSGSVFIRSMISNVLNLDTASIIASHALPTEADISSVSLGVSYDFNNTNYRFNPRRGNELDLIGSVGTKTIHRNAQIQNLSDPSDPGFDFNSLYDTVKLNSYEFQVRLSGAHYFPLTRTSTLKLGFNGGAYSSPVTYRNELFLIGGYKLLRGFDEASILAAQYAVGTLEYRYLIGLNSFLFGFVDGGWAANNVPDYALNNVYIGTGIGMAFETKAGIFNISYAVGKTSGTNLDFRDAKIHLGYVSFF